MAAGGRHRPATEPARMVVITHDRRPSFNCYYRQRRLLASAIADLARSGGPEDRALQIGRRIFEEKQVSFTQLHRARRAVARHKRSRSPVPTSKDQTQNTVSVSYRSERGKDVRSGDESWGHRLSYQALSR